MEQGETNQRNWSARLLKHVPGVIVGIIVVLAVAALEPTLISPLIEDQHDLEIIVWRDEYVSWLSEPSSPSDEYTVMIVNSGDLPLEELVVMVSIDGSLDDVSLDVTSWGRSSESIVYRDISHILASGTDTSYQFWAEVELLTPGEWVRFWYRPNQRVAVQVEARSRDFQTRVYYGNDDDL